MKKVIDGKMYNTETAQEIGTKSSDEGKNDFHYFDEALYKTPRGRFFLAGEGGAMTKYAQSCGGNAYCGGSGIIPLTETEALSWAESSDMDADEIAEMFNVAEA